MMKEREHDDDDDDEADDDDDGDGVNDHGESHRTPAPPCPGG
jgi:hypothetical protein